MAVLNKDEFMQVLKERIGESTDDKDLKFLEDMTDTYNDLCKQENVDWKIKYEENDKQWKQKYKDRFFSGDDKPVDDKPVDDKTVDDKTVDEIEPEDVKLENQFFVKDTNFTTDTNEVFAGIAV